MTDKWQCCICKTTKVLPVVLVDLENGNKDLSAEDKIKLKCCFRIMRNLSEPVYIKESTINDSGKRG